MDARHRGGRGVLLAAACAITAGRTTAPTTQGRKGRNARHDVRFDFPGSGRPRIAADPRPDAGAAAARVDPEHSRNDIQAAGRQRTLSSATVEPGQSVTFKRNPNYWGRDLPVNRGLWNFDECGSISIATTTPFRGVQGRPVRRAQRDTTRRAGRPATISRRCATVASSRKCFPNGLPKGISALVFNTRRPSSPTCACARRISLLFDFEWINANFYYGLYRRTRELLRRLRAVRLSAPGRRARARPARAVSRSRARRHSRGQLVAAGERRLAAATASGAPGAHAPCRRRLPAQRHGAAQPRDRAAARVRDPRHQPGRGTPALAFAQSGPAGIAVQVRLVDAVQYQRGSRHSIST